MYLRHGHDAVASLLQLAERLEIIRAASLHLKHADDDMEIVLDAVVNLSEQRVALRDANFEFQRSACNLLFEVSPIFLFHCVPGFFGAFTPSMSQARCHPGEKFPSAEWLYEVIICAGVDAF